MEIGDGSWVKGNAAWDTSAPRAVAASGAWNGNDTFTAKLCFHHTPFVQTITLEFEGDSVRYNSEANVAFGPRKDPELIGKLSK